MQSGTSGFEKRQITLKRAGEDFQVDGFSAKYKAYCDDQGGEGESFGWFLTLVGAIMLAVGVATLMFGPDTIYYDRFAGPSLLQYIQMWPGPITTVGSLCLVIGAKLRAKFCMKPEDYFLENYQLVSVEGEFISSGVDILYVQRDSFRSVVSSTPQLEAPKEVG